MTPVSEPPRLAESLLRWLLPEGLVDESIRGDLREDHRAHQKRRGALFAHVWYCWASLTVGARYLAGVLPAARRSPERSPAPSALATSIRWTALEAREGARSSLRRPWSSAAVVLTLGLAIGASTSVFLVLRTVLLTPLGYAHPERLVTLRVNTSAPGSSGPQWYGGSVPEYYDFKEQISSLEALAGYVPGVATLEESDEPRRLSVLFTSHDLLPLLGRAPLLGRSYDAGEDVANAAPTVVLSHRLWRSHFGEDETVLGRTVRLGGADRTVVGVMPADFVFPDADTLAWMPLRYDPENLPNRSNHFLEMVGGRLEGIDLGTVQAETEAVASRLIETYPQNYSERGLRTRVDLLRDNLLGSVQAPLYALTGAVLFLLLVATVSAANLLLSRSDERHRDFAVRLAMGATRGRVTAQLVVEALLLALSAGAVGAAVSLLGARALVRIAPEGTPRIDAVTIDSDLLVVSLGLAAITGVITGLVPAATLALRSLNGGLALGDRENTASVRSRATQAALVALQIGFAVTLVAGALLMARTMHNLSRVDTGLRPEGVLTLRLNPDFTVLDTAEKRSQYYEQLLLRLEALPEVEAAAAVVWLPLADVASQWSIEIEGRPVESIGAAPDAIAQQVTPGFFDAVGVRAVRGRLLQASDRSDSTPVTLVNESMAQAFWPGEDPVGQRFRVFSEGRPWMEVVGVVGDVRQSELQTGAPPQFYVPHAQGSSSTYFTGLGMTLTLRGDGPPPSASLVRDAIRSFDPTAPISRVRALEDVVAASTARERFVLLVLGAFSTVALMLAAFGVYGVASYGVFRRTREIGVRMALGASPRKILAVVLRGALGVVVAGLCLGVAGGVATGVALRSILFEVKPLDGTTLGAVGGIVAVAALLASLLPARRAVAIDPTRALRSE